VSDGDFDPKLLDLYPESSEPDEIRHTLVKHARQHEMSLATIQMHYRLLKAQGVTLERLDQNLDQFIAGIEMERAEKKLQEARGEYSLKKMTAILGFAGAVIGSLVTGAVTYLTRESKIPHTDPPTAEQVRAYEEHQRAAKHEPVPTAEFNAIVDGQK